MKHSTQARQLTPERERLNLFKHGTVPWKLTPATILETAKSDIRAKAINADMRKRRAALPVGSMGRKLIGPLRRFAFVPAHVEFAATPGELLKRAIENRVAGRSAQNVNTLAIYSDGAGLWAALALAQGEGP